MTRLPLPSLLCFILFLLTSSPFSVISQTPNSDDRLTLLDLKRQFGDPPSVSWNAKSSPCNWLEIECSGGSVTGIVLKDKNITVAIPPIICNLENLTYLDLSYNYIPGSFPTVLYNCSKLQYLDISQNYFVGPIPGDVDRLSSDLAYLGIGANNFSGDIPRSIGGLRNLKTLFLYQNEFNGTFPAEIGSLSELEVLGMAHNNKFVPAKIPVEFGNLKKLTFMWMTEMNLIGEIPAVVFNNLTALNHVDLSKNELTGRIPDEIFGLENLTNLYLYKNRLNGEIPRSISALNLVELDLSMNNLTGSIPESFGNLSRLELLNLFFNQLTGQIPESFGKLPKLRDFRVYSNRLSGELPSEIGLNSKLKGFEVSDNRFTGNLPENLCRGGVLLGVVAFSNNLTGEIPKSLGNCNSLRTIQLYDNRFTGEIPLGVWTLFNISSLRLSNNLFTGKLPEKLAWNLSRIEIENNRFSGEIPRKIGSWTRLIVFQASNNMFSGIFPEELTYLSNLNTLLLDRNRLSGELPEKIVSWRSLTTLNLSKNRFSGKIPASLGSLQNLLNLDLSENLFSGEIPPEIGNLRLTFLNLSSNSLSGKIPEAFDNLAYDESFLRNSNLCADTPVLRFPDCRAKQGSSRRLHPKILAAILVLTVLVFLIAVVSTAFGIKDYCKRKRRSDFETWKLTSFHRLEFTEGNILSSLTENNVIGSGGSGKVYKIAVNSSGDKVAVKRIWNNPKLDEKLEKEFIAEVEILGMIRHANIVKLLCCISSDDSKLLVYEYMENQSLDQWLHPKFRSSDSESNQNVVLDWPRRLQIAIGAAQGLCYMHHDCSPAIIHRDVKSSNILLDSEFGTKIADFGLAKILVKDVEHHTMSAVAGSFGYIAPEYAYTSKVNEKIDVYSFGVVLLELVTGRQANKGDEHSNLADWSLRHYQEGKPISDTVDEDIKENMHMEEILTVFKLGLICTSRAPNNRPSMKEVLHVLRRCGQQDVTQGLKKARIELDERPLLVDLTSHRGSKRIKENQDRFESLV